MARQHQNLEAGGDEKLNNNFMWYKLKLPKAKASAASLLRSEVKLNPAAAIK